MNSLWINRITLALAAPGLAAAAWGAAAWGAADIFSDEASLPPPQRPVRLYKEPDSLKQVEGLPNEPAAIPSTNLKDLSEVTLKNLAETTWNKEWETIWSLVESLHGKIDPEKEPVSRRDWIIWICDNKEDDPLESLRNELGLKNLQDKDLQDLKELEELEDRLSKLAGDDSEENLKSICKLRTETLSHFETEIKRYSDQIAAIASTPTMIPKTANETPRNDERPRKTPDSNKPSPREGPRAGSQKGPTPKLPPR